MYLNVSFTPIENLSDDNEAEILVRTYMFRSNEYRQGPIEFAMKFCSAFKRQDFDIPNLLANSNLKCPILKNHNYYVYNFAPNATNFPPLIPEGRWKLQLVFKYRHKYNMAVLNWYMGVVYNVPFDPSL
ncbi:hypothetical protein FQR65_LT07853 [Abscondita terminalis]|nr:hypothetical protein FQR65_LT07853 [Abscondita terminalis]